MPFQILRYTHPHFEIQGDKSVFKVHHSRLAPSVKEQWHAACGGVATKKAQHFDAGGIPQGQAAGDQQPENQPMIPPAPQMQTPQVDPASAREKAIALTGGNLKAEVYNDPQAVQNIIENARGAETATQVRKVITTPTKTYKQTEETNTPAQPAQPQVQQQPQGQLPNGAAGMPQFPEFPKMPGVNTGPIQGLIQQSIGQQQHGAELQQQAQSQQAEDALGAYQRYQAGAARAQSQWQYDSQAAVGKINSLQDDVMNSRIDPELYWTGHRDSKTGEMVGEHSKLQAGIGMIIAGVGQGLMAAAGINSGNLASQVIQRGLDREMEAQRSDIHRKETLLGFYYRRFGDIQQANLAARADLQATLAGEIGLAGARAGDMQSKATAEILKGQVGASAVGMITNLAQLQYQSAMARYQMEWQQSMMHYYLTGGGGPSSGVTMLESSTSRIIPEKMDLVGISKARKEESAQIVNFPELSSPGRQVRTLAPTPEIAKESNATLAMLHSLDKNVNIMEELGRKHGWKVNAPEKLPNPEQRQYELALREININLGRAAKLSRFTKPEDEHYQEILGNPLEWIINRKAGEASMQGLRGMFQRERQQEYDRLGVRGPPRPPQRPAIQ